MAPATGRDAALELSPPDEVRFGGKTVRVGGLVWKALKCVRPGKTVPEEKLVREVWGDAPPKPGSVREFVSRVNRTLEKLGCPHRLLREGGTVEMV